MRRPRYRDTRALCLVCGCPLDRVWTEMGVQTHPSCSPGECEHGEPRGSRYCPLCRASHQ